MTRLHQHFGQALVPIDDGSSLLNEFQCSLEAFNRANEFLGQFSQGNVENFGTFMALYQNQVPELGSAGEDVSLEAYGNVEAVVDHPAVKSAIAWLKKWIPIIIQQVKELGLRFLAWLKQKYSQTSAKIKRLAKQIDRELHPEVTLRATTAAQGEGLVLLKDSRKLRDNINLSDAEHLVDWCWDAKIRLLSSDDPVELNEFDYCVEKMGAWLTNSGDLSKFQNRDNENYKTLPAPGIAAGEYSVSGKSESIAPFSTDYTTLGKKLKELDAAQLKLIDSVEKLKFKMDSLAVSLGRFRVHDDMGAHKADDVRWVLDMLNWTSTALMHGSRRRMYCFGQAVDLVEDALKLD